MNKHRGEIDGLRAIALIGAMSFHAQPQLMPGGYVSVDMFFVISGYLITQIIRNDIDRDRFSLVRFYERRVQRILPALFAMLIASCAAAWILLPDDLASFGKTVAAVAGFSGNLLFASWNNYFRLTGQMTPLLHSWSLGIEEQFYLMLPLALFLMRRWSRPALLGVLAAVGLASFVYGAWIIRIEPDKTYYSLPARAWEFLLGALLATGLAPRMTRPLLGDALAACGLAITAYLYLRLPVAAMPGLRALAPCLAAAMILHGTNSERSRVAGLLSFKPLAQLGLASYSIYLWHWTIMVFATYYVFDEHLALLIRRIATVAAIPVGFFSLRYIERPFRPPREILSRKPLFLVAGGLSAALIAFGLFVAANDGFPTRFGPQVAALNVETRWLRYPCAERPLAGLASDVSCRLGDPGAPPEFVLWGDSHAAMYHAVLDRIARQHHVAGYDVSTVGCAPLLDWHLINVRMQRCQTRNREVMAALDALHPRLVILGGGWEPYFGAYPPGNDTADAAVRQRRNQMGWQYAPAEMRAALGDVLNRLHAMGADVYFVRDVPGTGIATATRIAKSLALGTSPPPLPSRARYEQDRVGVLTLVAPFERQGLVTSLDPLPVYCDDTVCRVMDDGGPYYLDDNHLTEYGAARMGRLFDPLLDSLEGRRSGSTVDQK